MELRKCEECLQRIKWIEPNFDSNATPPIFFKFGTNSNTSPQYIPMHHEKFPSDAPGFDSLHSRWIWSTVPPYPHVRWCMHPVAASCGKARTHLSVQRDHAMDWVECVAGHRTTFWMTMEPKRELMLQIKARNQNHEEMSTVSSEYILSFITYMSSRYHPNPTHNIKTQSWCCRITIFWWLTSAPNLINRWAMSVCPLYAAKLSPVPPSYTQGCDHTRQCEGM